MTVPLWRIDPSIAPHETGFAADPEPTARVVPWTSRASTLRFPTRTRQFGTTLPWSLPAKSPLLCCSPSHVRSPRSAHIRRCVLCVAHCCESRSVHSLASGDHRLVHLRRFRVRFSRAWLASPNLKLGLASHRTCLPARFARLSCPVPALPPSSCPLIRRRSHSCVFDKSHSSDSEAQGQEDNAKSTGY